MPYDLASGEETVFWWRGNITPPKDWDHWDGFIEQFVRHVIERYGLAEVRRWYFERIATPGGRLDWVTTVQPFGVTLVEVTGL